MAESTLLLLLLLLQLRQQVPAGIRVCCNCCGSISTGTGRKLPQPLVGTAVAPLLLLLLLLVQAAAAAAIVI